jgi:hypothetical protein
METVRVGIMTALLPFIDGNNSRFPPLRRDNSNFPTSAEAHILDFEILSALLVYEKVAFAVHQRFSCGHQDRPAMAPCGTETAVAPTIMTTSPEAAAGVSPGLMCRSPGRTRPSAPSTSLTPIKCMNDPLANIAGRS